MTNDEQKSFIYDLHDEVYGNNMGTLHCQVFRQLKHSIFYYLIDPRSRTLDQHLKQVMYKGATNGHLA